MIIDANTHGFHGGYFGPLLKLGGKWAKQVVDTDIENARPRPQLHNPKLRLEQMDRFGIDYQVVTPGHWIDPDRYPGAARTKMAIASALNDNMAKVMEVGKGRLLAVGTISLLGFEQRGKQEMERALKLGLKGFSVASNIIGKPLDIFGPFWETAEELDAPIYIHPRHPQTYQGRQYEKDFGLASSLGWPYETALALARLVYSGVMKRHPKLKIISHHLGGGMIPFYMGRMREWMESSYETNTATDAADMIKQFGLFYHDTVVGMNAPAVRCAIDVFGTERLVFATDAPWGVRCAEERLANYPKLIRSLGLSQKETDAIFADNIRRALKLG